MAIYVFSPLLTSPTDVGVIGDDKFHVDVGSWARSRHEWGTYRVLGCRDSLADVTATDTLYVYAHGDYRTQLFYTKVGDRKALSPGQLAVILHESGLKDHADFVVHLFACTSGVVGEDGRTMAHRVATTLHRLGYRRLRVGGYVGFVSVGDGVTFQASKQFGGNLREATGHQHQGRPQPAGGLQPQRHDPQRPRGPRRRNPPGQRDPLPHPQPLKVARRGPASGVAATVRHFQQARLKSW